MNARATGSSSRPRSLAALDLNLLVALDALIRERSVTTAGKRVGLSQPAMSHALGRLRELLQDPLLVRVGRQQQLSALAERLAPRVRALMGDIELTLLGQQPFVPRSSERAFRIASNDYCDAVLLPLLLSGLKRTAPHVRLEIHSQHGDAPEGALARGELDLALGTFAHVSDELSRSELFREGFACVLRRDHPRVRARLTLDEFVALDHLLISSPGYGPGVVDQALAARGRSRRVAVHTPHYLAAPALIAHSDLVLTLPASLAAAAARAYRLRVVRPPLELARFAVELVWHPRFDANAALCWLRAAIVDAAAQAKAERVPFAR